MTFRFVLSKYLTGSDSLNGKGFYKWHGVRFIVKKCLLEFNIIFRIKLKKY